MKKITILSATAVTATDNGSAVILDSKDRNPAGYLAIGTITGTDTPTITVKLQHSPDGTNAWTDLISFTAVTATGTKEVKIPTTPNLPLLPYVRASYTITGTNPSFSTVNVYLFVEN